MDLIQNFIALLGESAVLRSQQDLAGHVTDWRGRYHGAARCVVRPGSTEEVAAVVRACAAAGVAIVPQGGNTGHVGGGIPDAQGVFLIEKQPFSVFLKHFRTGSDENDRFFLHIFPAFSLFLYDMKTAGVGACEK